jgi:hypothetical protein
MKLRTTIKFSFHQNLPAQVCAFTEQDSAGDRFGVHALIPYASEQGINSAKQGINSAEQGSYLASSEYRRGLPVVSEQFRQRRQLFRPLPWVPARWVRALVPIQVRTARTSAPRRSAICLTESPLTIPYLHDASVEKATYILRQPASAAAARWGQKPQTKGLTGGDLSMVVFLRTLLLALCPTFFHRQ